MTSISTEMVADIVGRFGTPIYICSWQPVRDALMELQSLNGVLPIRNWLSVKTQPLKPLLRSWKTLGLGAEVVSEFEYCAALSEGYDADSILINGVAKHSWASRVLPRSRVHFDSLTEIEHLITDAVRDQWRAGIRFHPEEEVDPDEPQYGAQFGIDGPDLAQAVRMLRSNKIEPESVHFYLRSNLDDVMAYQRACDELLHWCAVANFRPRFLDIGGGLPVPGERQDGVSRQALDLSPLRTLFDRLKAHWSQLEEVWLEMGRYLLARSAVLVVRVLDIKQRTGSRYLICDGGRTNHALVSDWENHHISCLTNRNGPPVLTTVCGPNCMAFDRLCRELLPNDLTIGDYLIWENAGAYHIPWETRFSRGLAPVVWIDDSAGPQLIRRRETVEEWWEQWNGRSKPRYSR